MRRIALLLIPFVLLLGACSQASDPAATPQASGRTPVSRLSPTVGEAGQILEPGTPVPEAAPLLATRATQVAGALASSAPIITLGGLDAPSQAAQQLAISDPQVLGTVRTSDGQPLRAEVFGVYPLSPADVAAAADACKERSCYRVEIYNFAANSTLLAIVDAAQNTVRSVQVLPDTQPTIVPRHLMDLAAQVALAAPEVRQALDLNPDATMIQQPQMKVQFQATVCERSRHLCVAPIFVWGERALWVIVDLADYTIVGLRWTELGASSRRPITEQRLQDDVVTARYCNQSSDLAREGWSLRYILTGSDGLRLDDVRFNGAPVLHSAKLVDVHISYSSKEGFGYSDALGCPAFSAAAVVAWNGPQIEPIPASGGSEGFALVQRFRSEFWPQPCNYAYEQRYEFYRDGRFRIVFVNQGRGCGNDGTYSPLLRIAPAAEQPSFGEWDGQGWRDWSAEGWRLQQASTAYTPEGYQYQLTDGAGGGWYIQPKLGQPSQDDQAFLYVSQAHGDRNEGESDLPTLGDCCRNDERQGPERFAEPAERLGNGPLVIWYVPQLHNDDTPGAERCWADAVLQAGVFVPRIWPCEAGILFVPTGDP